MDFWAVVGDGNSRKSSTVRALTGVRNSHPGWQIGLSGGVSIDVFVQITSPQENTKKLETPNQLADRVLRDKHDGVHHLIVSLRHDGANGLPDGIDYIRYFCLTRGWNCLGIYVSGNSRTVVPFLPLCSNATVASSNAPPYHPSNLRAAQLRQHWGFA